MKAIAAHTIFIVGVIIIFVLFVTATLFGWIDWSGFSANKFVCTSKVYSYCSGWSKTGFTNAPWDWDKKGPEGCENPPINIDIPSIDECKKLFPSK